MAPAEANRNAQPQPDIFARLRALSLLKDDGPAGPEDAQSNVNPAENTDAHSLRGDLGASNSSDSASRDSAESEHSGPGENTAGSAALPHEIVPERPAVSAPQEHSEEEESIDDYMARLMNRVARTRTMGRQNRAPMHRRRRQLPPRARLRKPYRPRKSATGTSPRKLATTPTGKLPNARDSRYNSSPGRLLPSLLPIWPRCANWRTSRRESPSRNIRTAKAALRC